MCARLGYEVHYVNLNGATDVQDLMGKYVPNIDGDGGEYRFADGKVTSGLRSEEGVIKVVVLDEYNSADPQIVIRLHEILDALERDGDVVLTEDASEVIPVRKANTKVVALTNPPGKGYIGRKPLDPAQIRRWVYNKLPNELPEATLTVFHRYVIWAGCHTREQRTRQCICYTARGCNASIRNSEHSWPIRDTTEV